MIRIAPAVSFHVYTAGIRALFHRPVCIDSGNSAPVGGAMVVLSLFVRLVETRRDIVLMLLARTSFF